MDPLDARNLHHHCCRRRRRRCCRLCQSKDCRQSTCRRRHKHHEHRGILDRPWTTDDVLSTTTAPLRVLVLPCESSATQRYQRRRSTNQPPPGFRPHTSPMVNNSVLRMYDELLGDGGFFGEDVKSHAVSNGGCPLPRVVCSNSSGSSSSSSKQQRKRSPVSTLSMNESRSCGGRTEPHEGRDEH